MSETSPLSLNITDIADAVKIIDYASEQGAFKGWANIRQVLIARDRLESFVNAAAESLDKADEPEVIETPPPPRVKHKASHA